MHFVEGTPQLPVSEHVREIDPVYPAKHAPDTVVPAFADAGHDAKKCWNPCTVALHVIRVHGFVMTLLQTPFSSHKRSGDPA